MTVDARPALTSGLPAMIAVVLLAAVVLFAPAVLNDGDTYWHLATGAWIWAHRQVPKVDIFSFSRPGIPWVAHEWLSEALMSAAFRLAGWSGVLILMAAGLGLAGWLMVRRIAASLSGITLLLVCVLAISCMAPSLLARPHLLALPVLVAWTIELLDARRGDRAPRLIFAGLMLLWANLHGSYVFGFLLAGAFGLEALIAAGRKPWPVIRGWGLFGAASLVACLISPHGIAGLIYPFQIMTLNFLPNIVEWAPENFARPSGFQLTLFVTLFVGLSRGMRVPPVRLILLLLLVYMALEHKRHQLVLACVAPLLLAEPLAAALGQTPTERSPIRRGALAGCAALLVVMAVVRLAVPVVRHDDLNTPATALAHVPAELARQPVLNDYGFGGYLIFKGVKPFIDGRSDMYGEAFSNAYFKATAPDSARLSNLLGQYNIAWTILRPTDPTVAVMDHMPGWRRLYADHYGVVHVRMEDGSLIPWNLASTTAGQAGLL
jgi:hypothetical protein